MKKRIWGVKCSNCQKRMFSFSVHDFKFCGCPAETFIDGGSSYIRSGWLPKFKKPTSIYWTEKLDGEYPVVKYKDSFPY